MGHPEADRRLRGKEILNHFIQVLAGAMHGR
jgi:hypothetical protein